MYPNVEMLMEDDANLYINSYNMRFLNKHEMWKMGVRELTPTLPTKTFEGEMATLQKFVASVMDA